MKNLIALALLALSLTPIAHAALIGSPFPPAEDARFDALETGSLPGVVTSTMILDGTILNADINASAGIASTKIAAQTITNGVGYVERIAVISYDPSATAGLRTVAPHASGFIIPANAIITQSWFFIKTAITSTSNDGTIAISCNSANDIFSAADIDGSSAGTITPGVEIGTAGSMLKVTTACDVTFTVAVHALLTGRIDLYVRYVIAE